MKPGSPERGFSLVEFTIAAFILLVAATGAFAVLGETQQLAASQAETEDVLEGCRSAMDSVEWILRQAGNDPRGIGFEGLAIVGATEVRVRSDITGSAGVDSDRGDPDGDTSDSGEDTTIRYDAGSQTLQISSGSGSPQAIAGSISGFNLQYFDAAGGMTSNGADVRRISVTVCGAAPHPDPRTGQLFSIRLKCDVQIATRQ